MTYPNNTNFSTGADLLHFMRTSSAKSPATQKDYCDAIKRLPSLCRRNRLEDVRVDLREFKSRFTRKSFDPAFFKREQAFLAWRGKVIAATKEFLGLNRPSVFNDECSQGLYAPIFKVGGTLSYESI